MSNITPHSPLPGILDREMAMADSRELLDKYSPYLRELVDYSTHLLGRCEKSLRGIKGTPASLIHLYYHSIQMTDGIEVLTSQCCFAAAVPLFRSLLEATFSVEYMLEDDFENRSGAWMVGSYLDRLAFLEANEPGTVKSKSFDRKMKRDKILDQNFKPKIKLDQLRGQIEVIKKQLDKPKFVGISSRFKGKGRIKKWFQINSKIKTFEQVAEKLNRSVEYEIFYRPFSRVLHANESIRMLGLTDGQMTFTPIRPGSTNLESTFKLTGAYLNANAIQIAGLLRPQERILEQIREIMAKHLPEMFNA